MTEASDPFSALNLPQVLRNSTGRGRKSSPLEFNETRQLEPEDLIELDEPQGSLPPALKAIRTSHHRVAHLLAQGHPLPFIEATCGITSARVWQLKQAPAFIDLIAFYTLQESEVLLDTTRKLADVAGEAVSVIHERLLDDADAVSMPQLLSISSMALDRSGHGPSSTTVLSEGPISSERIAQLKAEAESRQNGTTTIIDERAEEIQPKAPPQEDISADQGSFSFQSLEEVSEAEILSFEEGTEV